MKRAQTDIVHASFAKRYKVAHDFFDVGGVHDAVNGALINHSSKNTLIFPTKVIKKMQSTVSI
jgi:hypothetical protein